MIQAGTGGWTDYKEALSKAENVNKDLLAAGKEALDIIFFISDGDPRLPRGIQPTSEWQPIANSIKCPATADSTYIFGIGLGSGIQDANIQALSGADQLSATLGLAEGADWTKIDDADQLPNLLVDLAKSLRDNEAPVFTTCPR